MDDETTQIQTPQPGKKGNKTLLLIFIGILIAAAAVVATLFATGNLSLKNSDDDDDDDDIEMDDRDSRHERRHRRHRQETIEYDTRSAATDVRQEQNAVTDNVTENAAEAVEAVSAEYSGYDLDSRLLTDNELRYKSKAELRLLRNEIYARHGYIFQSKDLREYFGKQPWYYGHITNQNEVPLNKTERKNVELIKSYE